MAFGLIFSEKMSLRRLESRGIGAMAKGAEDWVREAREVKDAMREHSPAVSQWATEGKGESPPPAARPLLHLSLSLSLSLSLFPSSEVGRTFVLG